jgi:hypothetical protein
MVMFVLLLLLMVLLLLLLTGCGVLLLLSLHFCEWGSSGSPVIVPDGIVVVDGAAFSWLAVAGVGAELPSLAFAVWA